MTKNGLHAGSDRGMHIQHTAQTHALTFLTALWQDSTPSFDFLIDLRTVELANYGVLANDIHVPASLTTSNEYATAQRRPSPQQRQGMCRAHHVPYHKAGRSITSAAGR